MLFQEALSWTTNKFCNILGSYCFKAQFHHFCETYDSSPVMKCYYVVLLEMPLKFLLLVDVVGKANQSSSS